MTRTVMRLCRELVGIDTQNPPGNEGRVAAFVTDFLQQHGFTTVTLGYPGRENVVASLTRGSGRRLILQAHADTKPATSPGAANRWATPPLQATEHDGRVYGLGTCDTKGGMAAMLAAAAELTAADWNGTLVVQSVADEEDGSALGAELLLGEGLLDADAAVVAEPTSCRPSLAQLGNAWAEITITGRAGHAGTPDEALDAFRAGVDYIGVLDNLVRALATSPEFPGHPRLNVGYVSVPGHPGSIPGECVLHCDIRVLPGVDRDSIHNLYERAADQVATTGAVVAVRRYQGGGCRSHAIASDSSIAASFRSAQRATGRPEQTLPFLGGSDARYFAQAGVPALVYGPGSLRQAHAPDEFVPVAELGLAQRQLVHAARAFLAGTG